MNTATETTYQRCAFENGEYHCGRYSAVPNETSNPLCEKHAHPSKLYSVQDLARRNTENGGHFFEPDATRFFRSRLGSFFPANDGGGFFTTSEQFVRYSPTYHCEPRRYSVRRALVDGSLEDVEVGGERFQQFRTKRQADAYARKLAMAFNGKGVL